MAIPEPQLEIWSRRGADAGSKDTHLSVRAALDKQLIVPPGVRYEIYLQGSYRNATNIRGDSDVDLVIELTNPVFLDKQRLSYLGVSSLESHYGHIDYDWQPFRSDVEAALCRHYDYGEVRIGNKSIKVRTPYLAADVVVSQEFRWFADDEQARSNRYFRGMRFYVPAQGRWIYNYPKIHISAGEEKNARTAGRLKPAVRMFKNARNNGERQGLLADGDAASYFVECLVFNAPDATFSGSHQQIFREVVQWALASNLTSLRFQHDVGMLFDGGLDGWQEWRARRFVDAMALMWNDWR